jgi:hypothetical protein
MLGEGRQAAKLRASTGPRILLEERVLKEQFAS